MSLLLLGAGLALPGAALDADAAAIIANIEGASGDNQPLEAIVQNAINAFVKGCKSDGTWPDLSAGTFRLLAGPRTLAGIFKAGIGPDPTNVGFVAGDYSRTDGLINTTTKRLNLNWGATQGVLNDAAQIVWANSFTTLGAVIGSVGTGAAYRVLHPNLGLNRSFLHVDLAGGNVSAPPGAGLLGLVGHMRRNSSQVEMRSGGTTTERPLTSSVTSGIDSFLYARNVGGSPSSASTSRLCFYFDGPALPVGGMDSLDFRLTEYLIAIGQTPATIKQPTIGPAFIFAGESNSNGRGLNTDLAADELDANSSIRILNNVTYAFEDLDIGTNNTTDDNGVTITDQHGWEAGIQQHLLAETGEMGCIIVKTGHGGTNSPEWDVSTNISEKLRLRIGALRHLYRNPNMRVWFSHGINDALDGTAPATFRTLTEDLIARIRTEAGDPTLKFYATKLMSNSTAKDTINIELEAIAAADANFYLLDTSSLVEYPLKDEHHWNAFSMKKMAQAFLAMEFGA